VWTVDELRGALLEAYGAALRDEGDASDNSTSRFREVFEGWDLAADLYKPDDQLCSRIADYERWTVSGGDENPGQLMEEIAYLAFRCLSGRESLKSYQSFAAQHDLVISGSTPQWFVLLKFLHLRTSGRLIAIEAKNLGVKVDDAQFSRLCFILQNKFGQQCELGVFVTRFGATGFPVPGGGTTPRVLRDAYATQVLFHGATGKYVVVLDDSDLRRLTEPGALLRILEAKIRHVEEAGDLDVGSSTGWAEVELPPHLAKYELPYVAVASLGTELRPSPAGQALAC
jgi:hypothetical protein